MSTLLLLAVMSVGLATLVVYVLRLLGARRHGEPAVTSPPVAMAPPVVKSTSGFALSAAADNNNRVGENESRAESLFTVRGGQQATHEMSAATGSPAAGLRHRQQRQLIQTVVHRNDCPYDSEQVEKLYTQLLSKVSQRDAAAEATSRASLDRLDAAADPLSATTPNCFRSSELEWEKTRRRAAEEWAAFLLSSLDAYVEAQNRHEDFHFRLKRRRRMSGEEDETEAERMNGCERRRLVEVSGGGSVPTLRRRFQAPYDAATGLGNCVHGKTGVSGNGGTDVFGRVGRRVEEMRAEPRITSSDSSRRTIDLPRHSGRGTDTIMTTYSCWLERYHAEQRDYDPSKFRQTSADRRPPATDGRADDEFEAIVAYNEKILHEPQLVQWPWQENGKTAVECDNKMQKEIAKLHRTEPEVRRDRSETAAAGGKIGTNWNSPDTERSTGETSAASSKPAGLTETRSPALVKLAERFQRSDCCSPRQTSTAQRDGSAKLVRGAGRGTDDRATAVDRSVPTTTPAKTENRLGGTTVRQLLPVQRYLQRQLEKQKKDGNAAESGLEAVLLGKSPSTEAVDVCFESPHSAVASASVEKLVNFEQRTEEAELVAPTGGGSDELERLSGKASVSSDEENRSSDEALNEKDMWRQIVLEKCCQTAESDYSGSVFPEVGQQLPTMENGHHQQIVEVEGRDAEDTTWKDSVLEDFRLAALNESEKSLDGVAQEGDEQHKTAAETEPEEDSIKSPAAASLAGKDENENVTNSQRNSRVETPLHSTENEKVSGKIGQTSEECDDHRQQQPEDGENLWRNLIVSDDLSPSSVDVSALRLSVSGEWDEEKVFDEMRHWDVDDEVPDDEVDNWNNNRLGRQQHRKLADDELYVDGEETVQTVDGWDFVRKDVSLEAGGKTVLEKGLDPSSAVCNSELAVWDSIYSTEDDAGQKCRPTNDDDVTDFDEQLLALKPASETAMDHRGQTTIDHRQLIPGDAANDIERHMQRNEEPAAAEELVVGCANQLQSD